MDLVEVATKCIVIAIKNLIQAKKNLLKIQSEETFFLRVHIIMQEKLSITLPLCIV